MATVVQPDFRGALKDRRRRLEGAMAAGGESARLARLLDEVDDALKRIDEGTFGLCEECHDPIEADRLLVDPLVRNCLDHLNAAERRALEMDLDLAAHIQSGLLPKRDLAAAGWEATYHYEAAGSVSGDYCDLILPDSDSGDLYFLLGDVSGKGVAASMLMASLRATLRALIGSDLPLVGLMERANRLFCESIGSSHYATLVCGRASRTGRVEIANAGHCPPLVLHAGQVTPIEATGLPLGLFCSSEYGARTTQLSPGDTLFLYSDGFTEARNRTRIEYGPERLSRFLKERHHLSPRALLDACLENLTAFRSGAPQGDDLTLLALRRDARA